MSFEFAPQGSSFPAEYQGALFFADYSRDCIWAMQKNGNGPPSPGSIRTFVDGAANPVNLEFGPGGDLFYVDFDGGTIRRVQYTGGAPTGTTFGVSDDLPDWDECARRRDGRPQRRRKARSRRGERRQQQRQRTARKRRRDIR